MDIVFSLWDNETNNRIGDFDTESEAPSYLVEEVTMHGRDAVTTWALLRDEGDNAAMIAAGRDLVEYARTAPLRPA